MTEGNTHPGNPLTGDDAPVPTFCPFCGRSLEGWYWTTVDRSHFFPYLVCWNGKPRWLVAIQRRMSLTEPSGAHYAFMLPVAPVTHERSYRFNRDTGEPLA